MIKYDFTRCGRDVTINAVLVETNEDRMLDGEIKFFVDGIQCPDTNGVGVGAIGGLFNCGLRGSTFELRCTSTCTPRLSVVELYLYEARALSLQGIPYRVGGSTACGDEPSDTDYLFGKGSSFYSNTRADRFCFRNSNGP